jgi:hypothetical protein
VTTENNETLEEAVTRMATGDATVDTGFATALYTKLLSEAEPLFAQRAKGDAPAVGRDLVEPPQGDPRRRRLPLTLAAACVVVGGLVAGGVAWRASSRKPSRVSTTSVSTTTATTATTASATTTSGGTTSVPTTAPSARVSFLNLPPALTLKPLATVSVPAPEVGNYQVAIGDLGVAVGTYGSSGNEAKGRIQVAGFDGKVRTIDVDATGLIAYGPGDVAYTTKGDPLAGTFAVVAVSLSGIRAGKVVASEPADVNRYIEHPMSSFGHGQRGVIMRRDAGATAIGYVDVDGRPTTLGASAPPLFTADVPPGQYRTGQVRSSTGDLWTIEVTASPDAASGFGAPSPPAPSDGDAGVYWTSVGPNLDPTDPRTGMPSMGVVLRLTPDGVARWWSVPPGWDVVSSDLWGTVLAHREGDQLRLALADFRETPPPATLAACAASTQPVPNAATRIGRIDFDRDGVDDVTLWVARGSGSSTIYATLGDFVISETSILGFVDGGRPLAVVDLDGNGRSEVFLAGRGNTARGAIVLEANGCTVSPVRGEPTSDAPDAPFELLIGAGGNSCAPTGCFVKNTCVTRDGRRLLENVLSSPVKGIIEDPSASFETTPIRVTTDLLQLANGRITVVGHQERTYPSVADLPADVPSSENSRGDDQIIC